MGISRQAPQQETAECVFRSEAAAKHVVGRLQQELKCVLEGHHEADSGSSSSFAFPDTQRQPETAKNPRGSR